MFAFAGQIFQFVDRPGNVDNYGFNFTLRHALTLWKMTRLKIWFSDQSVNGWKLFRAKVFLGQSRHQPEVLLGLKYSLG